MFEGAYEEGNLDPEKESQGVLRVLVVVFNTYYYNLESPTRYPKKRSKATTAQLRLCVLKQKKKAPASAPRDCRVWGLGFRLWALGFRVSGLG